MELLVSNLVGVNTIHATSLVKSTFLFCPFTSPEIGLIGVMTGLDLLDMFLYTLCLSVYAYTVHITSTGVF
jgi:hypothetical protein